MRRNLLIFGSVALGATLILAGCQNTSSPAPPTSAPSAATNDASPSETADSAPKSEDEKIAAEMAKLPEADRELAMKQKVCPVSDAPLGSMEGMKKVQVNGRDVFICCAGCEEFLLAEPEKYLAKLPAPADK